MKNNFLCHQLEGQSEEREREKEKEILLGFKVVPISISSILTTSLPEEKFSFRCILIMGFQIEAWTVLEREGI